MTYHLFSCDERKALKPHRCIWCGEMVNSGERYLREKSVYDGRLERARQTGGGAHWFSLVMGAAAALEDAANCLRDPDAKRVAMSAAEHYRKRANDAARAAMGGKE